MSNFSISADFKGSAIEQIKAMIDEGINIEDYKEVEDWLIKNIFGDILEHLTHDGDIGIDKDDIKKIMECAKKIKEKMEEENQ